MSQWRKTAREVINQVIADNPTAEGEELRKLLRPAYPFGERANWPYKVWLDEVKKAVGTPHEPTPQEIREFWVS